MMLLRGGSAFLFGFRAWLSGFAFAALLAFVGAPFALCFAGLVAVPLLAAGYVAMFDGNCVQCDTAVRMWDDSCPGCGGNRDWIVAR